MITEKEYLEAVCVIREYHKQIESELKINKTSIDIIINDFAKCNGQSFSNSPSDARLHQALKAAKHSGFLYVEDLSNEDLKRFRNTGPKSISLYMDWKNKNIIL